MQISSPQTGWAEQNPELWWEHSKAAVNQVLTESQINNEFILGIGISYQMHGLVIVDKHQNVLRPSIIWCDSRAVEIGDHAFTQLGERYCLTHLLNSPGNFTASKLKWVKDHEPAIYSRVSKAMLPGDYLAMKLTGTIATTISGLSEGMMWDHVEGGIPTGLFDFYAIDKSMVADVVPTFIIQGQVSATAASETGLKKGTPVAYRAGDQPNNAFSLNTLNPGEVASTAGTSGVIYGIVDKKIADRQSRVNTFVHVNDSTDESRYGILLCVNGTGIMNSWLRRLLTTNSTTISYEQLNKVATEAPVGSDHLKIFPFGNGAERIFRNKNLSASIEGLDLNRHSTSHVARAAQEGIVFALRYGLDIMHELGIESRHVRAGHANMFLSDVFCETFVNVTGSTLELYNTDGAQGAARGAGVGIGFYKSTSEAFNNLKCIKRFDPSAVDQREYHNAFEQWRATLQTKLNNQ
jgi:xylulokinase